MVKRGKMGGITDDIIVDQNEFALASQLIQFLGSRNFGEFKVTLHTNASNGKKRAKLSITDLDQVDL